MIMEEMRQDNFLVASIQGKKQYCRPTGEYGILESVALE